jgi:flagellar biosynthesis protein FlhG
VVINRELTSLTDAYAIVKVMYQVFGRQSFSIIANNVKDEKEGSGIFKNIDTISQRFLGFPLHYLGHVVQDDVVPKAILKQEMAVLAFPHSRICANFSQIGKAIFDFKKA